MISTPVAHYLALVENRKSRPLYKFLKWDNLAEDARVFDMLCVEDEVESLLDFATRNYPQAVPCIKNSFDLGRQL